MYSSRTNSSIYHCVQFASLLTLATLLSTSTCNLAVADFLAVGDVSGTVDEAGGATGDLIIGDTGTGGLLADGAAPFIGTLGALESDNVILGNQENSIGAANIEDFIPGTDANWQISNDLVVGHAGLGFLDFLNAAGIGNSPSASVEGNIYVGGDSSIFPTTAPVDGVGALGEGIVRVNGLGTRLQGQEDVYIGNEGKGVVEVSGRASMNTLGEVFVGSLDSTGDGTVTLTDLGTRWSAEQPVSVGGFGAAQPTNGSHGKIVVSNEAVFQLDAVTDLPFATLTINPRGRLELENGTVRVVPQGVPANFIVNDGLILGDGFIDGGIVIGPTGEIRNAAGIANEREYLLVAEAVENNGTIQSLGGAMEFEAGVTNNLEIVARDAELHFRAGVTNETGGSISIGGDTILHGTVTGNGGSIFVLSDSESLLVGDLVFTASSILGLTVGPDAGTLDVTGEADLSGALFALDYSAGLASEPGDSYQIFQADGGITGVFPAVAVADGRLWDIELVGSDTLVATATGALTAPSGADFNGDGIVDALDIAIWEGNYPINSGALQTMGDANGDGDVDGSDFLLIQLDLGGPPSIMAAVSATVPEPTTLALALLTIACCPRRRVSR